MKQGDKVWCISNIIIGDVSRKSYVTRPYLAVIVFVTDKRFFINKINDESKDILASKNEVFDTEEQAWTEYEKAVEKQMFREKFHLDRLNCEIFLLKENIAYGKKKLAQSGQ